MIDAELVENLSNAFGPSGFENEVRDLIEKKIKRYVDEIEEDSFGNLIAVKKGTSPLKVMVAAHMDEVGFSVKYIDDKGFLRFTRLGSTDERILIGCKVKIRTSKGFVRGAIGSKPPHLLKEEERKKVIELGKLFIDVGAQSKKEVARMRINIGDPIVFDSEFTRFGNLIAGKAFDDRLGCAVLIEIAKRLKKPKPTVYLVATTQEEVGLKGARVVSYKIDPALCLVIDTTIAGDHPEIEKYEAPVKVGKGPSLGLVEGGGRGAIMSPKVRELLVSAAKSRKIPHQIEVQEGGMTDAAIVQLTKEGVPAGAVGIPTRYIHSPTSVASLDDVEHTVELIVEAISMANKFFG